MATRTLKISDTFLPELAHEILGDGSSVVADARETK